MRRKAVELWRICRKLEMPVRRGKKNVWANRLSKKNVGHFFSPSMYWLCNFDSSYIQIRFETIANWIVCNENIHWQIMITPTHWCTMTFIVIIFALKAVQSNSQYAFRKNLQSRLLPLLANYIKLFLIWYRWLCSPLAFAIWQKWRCQTTDLVNADVQKIKIVRSFVFKTFSFCIKLLLSFHSIISDYNFHNYALEN